MVRLVTFLSFYILSLTFYISPLCAQEKLNAEGRDTAYVRTILTRADKNIAALEVSDSIHAAVRTIVANRYFELNDIYAERDTAIAVAKRTLTGDEKNHAIDAARAQCDSRLYRSHFALPARLGMYLTDQQVEQVKDGITMGVVKVTYDATIDMIPTLTPEERHQILLWLREARELALDAESSKKKHEVFGKYKGRINNYLSARGYDLVKEREAWYERVKARGEKL